MADNAAHGIDELKAHLGYTDKDIYGIEVDIPNNSITRVAGAVGKTAGVDFDNINAYKRRRCILADDRTVLAYYGETGYTETGKTTVAITKGCLLYTSPSPRDSWAYRMPSSAWKKKKKQL